jgi:hypothetical protein
VNRLLYDLPREQYEAIVAERWTNAKEVLKSPAHYKYRRDNPEDSDRDLLVRGAAGHVAVLEPDLYGGLPADKMPLTPDGTLYAYWPEANQNRSSNAYKAFAANCKVARKTPIREVDHDWCMAIAAAVRSCPAAQPYLVGPREVSMQWTHVEPAVGGLPGWSMPMKGRVDKVAEVDGKPACLIDLKSTIHADPTGFAKEVNRLGYHAQASLYIDAYFAITGVRLPFRWIAVEEKAPHNVVVYKLRPIEEQLGRMVYRDALQRIHACNESGDFPGYASGEMELEFPDYLLGIEEEAA